MASRLDTIAADDFPRAFGEATEIVIRRIGGQAARTENVEAVVEFDADGGGLADDGRGQRIEATGKIDIPAGQANTLHDTWVIRGEVYQQIGAATGKDGGTKTIQLTQRKGQRAREPRTTGGR